MSRFELHTEVDGAVLRVRVSGELDLDTSPNLLQSLKTSIATNAQVEVDLANVDYIDSSGVAVLIHAYKLALKRGSEFALRSPSDKVRSVLELSQLQKFFVIRNGGKRA